MFKQQNKKNKCFSQSTSENGKFIDGYIIKTKAVENKNISTPPPKNYQIVKKQLNLF